MNKITGVAFEELKKNLLQDGVQSKCPIWCGSPAITYKAQVTNEPNYFWSPRAGGVFTIPAGFPVSFIQIDDEEVRKRVSSWIWKRNAGFDMLSENEREEIPELTTASIEEIGERKLLSAEQRIDRALQSIGRPPRRVNGPRHGDKGLTADAEPQLFFLAATECGSDLLEMDWLLRELASAGLIRSPGDSGPSGKPSSVASSYALTLKGLNRLETGGDATVSNTAFVAMWFDPKVDNVYERGIAPAIRQEGYEPMRIDRKHHVRKIDDEIVAEIQRARFLVCDFTCGLLEDKQAESGRTAVARGGVYYEAGLAHGLGKQVIWTCRSDLMGYVHFDLRQYNTILWENGKEDQLQKALFERIRAVIA